MTPKRKTTRRDLPAICLLHAVVFGACAIWLPFVAVLDMAKESELQPISGAVERVLRTTGPRAGPKLTLVIRADDRLHNLTQDDLTEFVPALADLRAGDKVAARVRPDNLGRDLEWYWELQRNGATTLSYQQTRRLLDRRNVRIREISLGGGIFALALFIVAILLRRHFGVWMEPYPSVPAGDAPVSSGSLKLGS